MRVTGFGRWMLVGLLTCASLAGQQTSVTLATSANPAVFGQPLILTATVTPSAATGSVTFYDSAQVLGIGKLSGGQAVLKTSLLPSGARSLKAYYAGGGSYAASLSMAVAQTVMAMPANGFLPAAVYPDGSGNGFAAVGDFNGDGKADVVATSGSGVIVLLGNADGTFSTPISSSGPVLNTLLVGDFNGDGISDLAGTTAAGVAVMLGNGDGTFRMGATSPAGASASKIAMGDFNGDGKVDVAVTNDSGSVSVLLGNGDGTFQATVNYNSVTDETLVVGDFNGDGKADIATCGVTGGNGFPPTASVNVLLGNGDGTFQHQVSYPTAVYPQSMALGDFNGDGISDIVLANGTASISVLLGNGDGTFKPFVNFPGASDGTLVVGDFNGDGRADVAFVISVYTQVSVLLASGDGTLASGTNYSVYAGIGNLVVGDFNGDGRTDIALSGPGGLNILYGEVRPVSATSLTSSLNPSKAGQTITLTATVTPSSLLGNMTFYDGASALGVNPVVNGQATLTLTTLAPGTHSLTAYFPGDSQYVWSASPVLTQTVSGVLPPITIALESSLNPSNVSQTVTLTANMPASATGIVTFFDGITALESEPLIGGQAVFATTLLSPGKHSLTAFYEGGLSFAPATSTPVIQTVHAVPANGFSAAAFYSVDAPWVVAVGDLNGDGKADLAVAGGTTVSVLLAKGDGTFQPAVTYGAVDYPVALFLGDFNSDGKMDIAAANSGGMLSLYLGNGDGTFRAAMNSPGAPSVVADFNGDGKLDLAYSSRGNTVLVRLGNGDGTFQAGVASTGDGTAIGVVADFNNDGKPDIASVDSVMLGNGDGTFRAPVKFAVGSTPVAVAAGDFNNDGKPDLVLVNQFSNNVSVMLGNGDGTFGAPVIYPAGSAPQAVTVADINGDGKLDLVVADPYTGIVVLTGNGDGTFQPAVSYAVNGLSIQMATGDFNGDGKTDIAISDHGADIAILLGTGATQLKFTPQPAGVSPGTALPAVVVQAQDANGNVVPGTYAVTVTSYPAGVSATATAINGIATFSNLVFSTQGTYNLTATSFGLPSATSNSFTIAYPPSVVIDSPAPGAVLTSGSIVISGWAIDNVNAPVSAISSVKVVVDGTVVGTATYGVSRPDVCAFFPGRAGCPNVGYSFSLNLAAGTHTITVSAADSEATPVTGSASVTVTVQIPMVGTKAGVFRNNMSFLEDSNGDGIYEAGTDRFIANFTGPGGFLAGDVPVVGDWTGARRAAAGIYRGSTGQWFLDANNDGVFGPGDLTYSFGGLAGDMPVVGDWTDVGRSCIGIYRSAGSVWLLDLNCNGIFENTPTDAFFPFGGLAGDVPVVGAWTGGATRVGVVRKYAPGGVPQGNPFYWVLDAGAPNAGNSPVNHPPAVTGFAFGGLATDIFVTGDWYNTGISGAGVYRAGFWVLDAALPSAPQANHVPGLTFGYGGLAGDVPISGKW